MIRWKQGRRNLPAVLLSCCPAVLQLRRITKERVLGLTCPLRCCFYTQTQVEYSEDASVRDKQYRGAKIAAQNARLGTRRAHEYAVHVLAHFMFLSLSLLHSDSPTLLNLFIFFLPLHSSTPSLALSLSLCCVRPSSLISRGPIILGWPPHLLPTGALEGQKILMLTDVNLHDFLASISTTVVCLQLV